MQQLSQLAKSQVASDSPRERPNSPEPNPIVNNIVPVTTINEVPRRLSTLPALPIPHRHVLSEIELEHALSVLQQQVSRKSFLGMFQRQ